MISALTTLYYGICQVKKYSYLCRSQHFKCASRGNLPSWGKVLNKNIYNRVRDYGLNCSSEEAFTVLTNEKTDSHEGKKYHCTLYIGASSPFKPRKSK